MARLNYSFKGKYLATISARYDGSSRLAEGHQWVAFPAAALAWRINEESFMQNVHFLSNLKLRVGYGVVASSEVDPYETKVHCHKNHIIMVASRFLVMLLTKCLIRC